jgi:hypothetical protein
MKRLSLLLAIICAAALMFGCALTSDGRNRAATVSSVSPSTVVAGSSGMTILVTGSNFNYNTKVMVNGRARPTTGAGVNRLEATLTSAELAAPTVLRISVSSANFVAFTVSDASSPVQILTSSLPSATMQASYTTTLAAQGGKTPYSWSVTSGQLPPGTSLSAASGVISGTPSQSGNYSFSAQLTDASSTPQSASQLLSVNVGTVTTPLSVTFSTFPAGITQNAYATAASATGGTTPYVWSISSSSLPAGLSLNPATGAVTGTPTTAGTSNFSIQVRDSSVTPQTATAAASIMLVAPLKITTTSLSAPQVQSAYSVTMASSGGMAPYVWSLSAGSLPVGLSLNSSTGVINGMPTTAGTYSFTVRVDDPPQLPQSATQSFTMTVPAPAPSLSISTTSLSSGQVQVAYSASLAATGGTAPYSWSAVSGSLPVGLSMASNGVVSGTPTTSGTSSFTVQATDSGSPAQTATKALSITIAAAAPGALQITTTGLSSGQVQVAYSASLTATGGTVPYSWSVVSGSLPAGLSMASTGAVSGTPTTSGTSSFTVQATDSGSPAQTATKALSITIAAAAPSALQITTTNLSSGQVQVAYSASVTATGGTQPYSWSVASGSLPAGVNMTSSGVISGTPTASGASSFTVQVKDSAATAQTANQSLSINVSAPASIGVTVTPAPATVIAGQTQWFVATVTGTTNTAVTWSVNSVAGGNSTVGTISTSGQYTAPAAVPSPATVTVTATSQADSTTSASASVTDVTAATGSISVQFTGATPTQAVLSYTAPDTNPCTLQVMENSSSSPLVHDVDPALFSGSNTDSGGAPQRFWVIGKRTVAQGADGNYYSRALQAYTSHYYLLTCGSQQTQGFFTTANIPNGNTFGDAMLQDPSTEAYLFPTLPDTNGASYIDPLTGVFIKRFGTDGDTTDAYSSPPNKPTPAFWSGGYTKMCSSVPISGGYYCGFNGGSGIKLYWLNPTDGTTNFLGSLWYSGGTSGGDAWDTNAVSPGHNKFDPDTAGMFWDTTITHAGKIILLKIQYTGPLTNQAPNSLTHVTGTVTVTDMTPSSVSSFGDLVHAFDNNFDPAVYGNCLANILTKVSGHTYLLFRCLRQNQNSAAWEVVLDLGNKQPLGSGGTLSVVAAMPTYANVNCRWCGDHAQQYVGNQGSVYLGLHGMSGAGDTGPYVSSLTSGVSAGTTTFAVSGEPASLNPYPPGNTFLQNTAAGDFFQFMDGTPEVIHITTKTNSTTWQVARGCHPVSIGGVYQNGATMVCDGAGGNGFPAATAHSSSAQMFAQCFATPNVSSGDWWWNFLADPHGTDTTNTNFAVETGPDTWSTGGHMVARTFWTTGVDVTGGVRLGAFPSAQVGHIATFVPDPQPLFSGRSGSAQGETYESHPNYDQDQAPLAEQGWYTDARPFLNGGYNDSAALVSGKANIYKWTPGAGNPFNIYIPYHATSGWVPAYPFQDISGPGSVLADSTTRRLCIAHAANECVTGSSAGDVYFSSPTLDYTYCTLVSGKLDICIDNTVAYGPGVTQSGLTGGNVTSTDPVGVPIWGAAANRLLCLGCIGAWRQADQLANAHVDSSGKWIAFPFLQGGNGVGLVYDSVRMIKVPPQPASDGVDRTDFVKVVVPTVPVAGAVAAVVDFGDDSVNFYCTQRAETCRAVSATYSSSTPFKFKITDSYTGVTPGTSIILPLKPLHVVYYRVVYLDGNKNVVQTSPTQVVVDSFKWDRPK